MGYERSYNRKEVLIRTTRPAKRVRAPVSVRVHFRRKLDRMWARHRLKAEVDRLMRHAETLQAAAVGPPDDLTVSLRNARSAVSGLRTELDLWGLLEVRPGQPGASVEALLEYDITDELARHGITLDPSVEERFDHLRRELLDERTRRMERQRRTSGPGGPDGGFDELLKIALTMIDDLLEDQNVHDGRWQHWARRVLELVSDLLLTLSLGITAVGLSVLVIDESLAIETTRKAIEVLTAVMGVKTVRGVRGSLRPPDVSGVLNAADKGLRSEVSNTVSILRRVGFRQPLTTRDRKLVRQLRACVAGHAYTIERLIEIADDTEWPQGADYVSLCTRLGRLSDRAVEEATDASRFSRWRLSRTTVPELDRLLTDLGGFRVPDALPLRLPA